MTEDEKSEADKRDRVDSTDSTVFPSEAKHSPTLHPNGQGRTQGTNDRHQDDENNPGRFSSRITLNEALTLLVAIASLVVSYFTYKNAADTSDLKIAVGNLTALASETHRQADAMQVQAKAMQGQLDQMMAAQRPWLSVSDLSVDDVKIYPVGAGVVVYASYKITNLGQSPAVAVFISPALAFVGIDNLTEDTVRQLCRPQPAGDERLLATYDDTILSGRTLTIDGLMSMAGMFGHSLTTLNEAGRRSINADFVLVGCVTYRVLGSNVLRETGFAFEAQALQVIKATGNVEFIEIDIGQKGSVKTGPVIANPSPFGNFAN